MLNLYVILTFKSWKQILKIFFIAVTKLILEKIILQTVPNFMSKAFSYHDLRRGRGGGHCTPASLEPWPNRNTPGQIGLIKVKKQYYYIFWNQLVLYYIVIPIISGSNKRSDMLIGTFELLSPADINLNLELGITQYR